MSSSLGLQRGPRLSSWAAAHLQETRGLNSPGLGIAGSLSFLLPSHHPSLFLSVQAGSVSSDTTFQTFLSASCVKFLGGQAIEREGFLQNLPRLPRLHSLLLLSCLTGPAEHIPNLFRKLLLATHCTVSRARYLNRLSIFQITMCWFIFA